MSPALKGVIKLYPLHHLNHKKTVIENTTDQALLALFNCHTSPEESPTYTLHLANAKTKDQESECDLPKVT